MTELCNRAETDMLQLLGWHRACDYPALASFRPSAPDGNYSISVKICWWYWSKFSIVLESGESPVCSHRQSSAIWTPCFMSFLQMDESLSQSQARWLLLDWLCRHQDTHAWGHMCRRVCIRRCERVEDDESCTEHPFPGTSIPLKQPERRSDQLHAGAWAPPSVWALDGTPLLPKWAVAATELQLCILHLWKQTGMMPAVR